MWGVRFSVGFPWCIGRFLWSIFDLCQLCFIDIYANIGLFMLTPPFLKERKKIFLPKKRSIAISYIRSLLNDTILRDTMFKQGLEASPICICGNERETVDHFMLRCPIYATQRNDLFLSYKVITQQRMIPSLHHLIGHRWINDLSVQDELKLKEAVFNYFKSTAKSL